MVGTVVDCFVGTRRFSALCLPRNDVLDGNVFNSDVMHRSFYGVLFCNNSAT